MNTKLLLVLCGMASLGGTPARGLDSALTAAIRPSATHFSKTGVVDSFGYAPPSYTDSNHPGDFAYDVFYYIPESIRLQKNLKALIFLHGGGPSTLTRPNSIQVVTQVYLPVMKEIADHLGLILVMPSANGLNWNNNTPSILRDLSGMIRTELNVDADKIGLAGHSMGGMGVARYFTQLSDQFSFFMPLSAGVDYSILPPTEAEFRINPVFNVSYLSIQGLQDKFTEFVTRGKDLAARVQSLELSYHLKSKFYALFMQADHNFDPEAVRIYMQKEFKLSRDLYQSELFGTISTEDTWASDQRTVYGASKPVDTFYHIGSSPRYFWVESVNPDLSQPETFHFTAKAKENKIWIQLLTQPKQTKILRIYLHSKLVNLEKPIEIFINGKLEKTRIPSSEKEKVRSFDKTDPQFLYQDYVDVALGED